MFAVVLHHLFLIIWQVHTWLYSLPNVIGHGSVVNEKHSWRCSATMEMGPRNCDLSHETWDEIRAWKDWKLTGQMITFYKVMEMWRFWRNIIWELRIVILPMTEGNGNCATSCNEAHRTQDSTSKRSQVWVAEFMLSYTHVYWHMLDIFLNNVLYIYNIHCRIYLYITHTVSTYT